MESRYVLTKKPLEPSDVPAAQAEDTLFRGGRHGSRINNTPGEQRLSDFCGTGAGFNGLHPWISGLHPGLSFWRCHRTAAVLLPALGGIPGAHPKQLLKLLKTCYGLTDGPLAWYRHLTRRLVEDFGYTRSLADPCVFLLHKGPPGEGSLEGIVGVATDDLLHGGGARHWEVIERIAKEYKLGKNQSGHGRFTGKDIRLQADGSIKIDQAVYVADKVKGY